MGLFCQFKARFQGCDTPLREFVRIPESGLASYRKLYARFKRYFFSSGRGLRPLYSTSSLSHQSGNIIGFRFRVLASYIQR